MAEIKEKSGIFRSVIIAIVVAIQGVKYGLNCIYMWYTKWSMDSSNSLGIFFMFEEAVFEYRSIFSTQALDVRLR